MLDGRGFERGRLGEGAGGEKKSCDEILHHD
jgi:hypothetical protein